MGVPKMAKTKLQPKKPFKGDGDPRIHRAGRPKGAINRRTREFQEEAELRGVEPLMVMLEAMEHYRTRFRAAKSPDTKDAYMDKLVDVATCAAPYLHAKLKHVEHDVGEDTRKALAGMSDEQLTHAIVQQLTGLGLPVPPVIQAEVGGGGKPH